MITTIQEVTRLLEKIAPLRYQEIYDNAGLQTGNPQDEVRGVLVTLDCTEDVVEEAIERGCNLIVAHHPVIFKGLKSLTGRTYVERTIIKAIQHNIAIYASHTNLDNVQDGVNAKIADKLGLLNKKILVEKPQTLMQLVTFIPVEDTDKVLSALYNAGAGNIGEYSNCSFQVQGEGRFLPSTNANPTIGEAERNEKVIENRVEVIFPVYKQDQVISALRESHPYEEVAYYLYALENKNQEVGIGMIGELTEELSTEEFLEYLKEKMKLPGVRYTVSEKTKIKKVAVCGGSGSFLIKDAIRQGADAYVTGDVKYHEFFDSEKKLIIADIGHYESEVFTKEIFYDRISENFANFAVYLSEVNTNPIRYTY
jgi:dinuclear metal center YbgI/SA1388 family protein